MRDHVKPIGIGIRDAGLLLLLSESRIRRLLANGILSYAVYPNRVDVTSLRELFPMDPTLPLRERVLQRLLEGTVKVPRIGSRTTPSIHALAAAAVDPHLPNDWRHT